jgi:hypothetical protein
MPDNALNPSLSSLKIVSATSHATGTISTRSRALVFSAVALCSRCLQWNYLMDLHLV